MTFLAGVQRVSGSLLVAFLTGRSGLVGEAEVPGSRGAPISLGRRDTPGSLCAQEKMLAALNKTGRVPCLHTLEPRNWPWGEGRSCRVNWGWGVDGAS